MTNITETAYPKIRSYITEDELFRVYTPSDEELILAQENTKGDLSKICFLVTLKCFQRLGYFINITDIPKSIIEHITIHCNSIFNNSILKNYNKSSSKKRHLIIIREYLKIIAYEEETRIIVIDVATQAAKTKDNDADIINIVIEKLIKEGHEIDSTMLSLLSPYINQHINRFGRYSLDKERAAPELNFNIDLLKES